MEPEPIEYLSITGLFKARAAEESGERVLYMEASNETTDIQGERVLARSLRDSADHFLRYGNIDLDHRTLKPASIGDNPYVWEIGHPKAVTTEGDKTLVKAVLYQGDGEMAKNANLVWDSLTRITPPARWYPSVGGAILERGTEIDPLTKARVTLIKRVRWTNIGLSRTPVNNAVPAVSTVSSVGAEAFGKCCTAEGWLNLSKALEAGTATDLAAMAGGQAIAKQSLDAAPQVTLPAYREVRDGLAAWVRKRPGGKVSDARLAEEAMNLFGIPEDVAGQWAQRFLRDLSLLRRNA